MRIYCDHSPQNKVNSTLSATVDSYIANTADLKSRSELFNKRYLARAGTIQAFSLKRLEPLGVFTVSGVPTKVIAVGQQDRGD